MQALCALSGSEHGDKGNTKTKRTKTHKKGKNPGLAGKKNPDTQGKTQNPRTHRKKKNPSDTQGFSAELTSSTIAAIYELHLVFGNILVPRCCVWVRECVYLCGGGEVRVDIVPPFIFSVSIAFLCDKRNQYDRDQHAIAQGLCWLKKKIEKKINVIIVTVISMP